MTVGELHQHLEAFPLHLRVVAVPVYLTEDGVWHERIGEAGRADYLKEVVEIEVNPEFVFIGYAQDFAAYSAEEHPGGIL